MKLMKTLSLFLLMAVLLVGCSKDDDSSESASLIGTWKLTAEKLNGVNEDLDACDLKTTLVFSAATLKFTAYFGENCEESFEETGDYTRNGNTITIVFEDETQSVEITKLTNTTLEVTDEDEGEVFVSIFTRQSLTVALLLNRQLHTGGFFYALFSQK